jgi:Spy/CpxP family protein refolding chaperone
MRFRLLLAVAGMGLGLASCSGDSSGPSDQDGISLVPDFVQSLATAPDAGGIGGAQLPDSLKLSAEQKAAIAALHEAFKVATAADVAALRAIEQEARAAKAAGKSREEIHAILARGAPILERLNAAFAALQAAIWQVYTPAQRAWIESHRPKPCGPSGPPKLTDEQIQQIRALKEAFVAAVKDDLAEIQRVVAAARQAAQSGATRAEIEQILRQADGARARVREAEQRLQQAIDAVLTPEQKAARCDGGPKRP